tara:strand:+ start:4198 stop:5043 length:846 start_codon:yes stop_codon:yes gene_type:complete
LDRKSNKRIKNIMLKREAIIISYPRQGSNWLQYCIEYFSKKKTSGAEIRVKEAHIDDTDRKIHNGHGIGWIVKGTEPWSEEAQWHRGGPDIKTKENKVIMYGSEDSNEHTNFKPYIQYNKMILIVRNYKEVLTRTGFQGKFTTPYKISDYINSSRWSSHLDGYMKNIKLYDEFKGDKIKIYYEDFIGDFRHVEKVLSFLNVDYDLNEFNLEEHKQKSYNVYNSHKYGNKSATTMNTPLDFNYYTSRYLTEQDCLDYDNYMKNYDIDLYNRYLSGYEYDKKN